MADETFEMKVIMTSDVQGGLEAKRTLNELEKSAGTASEKLGEVGQAVDEIGGSASGAAPAADGIKMIGDAADEAGKKAGGAGGEIDTLGQLLQQLGGRSGGARDVFQGLTAALQGNASAVLDGSKGVDALIKSFNLGPVGLFAAGIGAAAAMLQFLSADAKEAKKSLNDFGETVKEERERLEALTKQELEFTAAKKAIADLNADFSATEGRIAALQTALAGLEQAGAKNRELAIQQEFAPGIAAARGAGDEDTAKRLESARDEIIKREAADRETTERSKAIAQIQGQIERLQQTIADSKEKQAVAEKEYEESLKTFVGSLRSARQFDLFPKDMAPGEIATAIEELRARLATLNRALADNEIYVDSVGRIPLTDSKRAEVSTDASNVQAAIDALQGFEDLKGSLESQKKDMDALRESTKKSLEEYNAQIQELTIGLATARAELLTQLQTQLGSAKQNLGLAQSENNAALGSGSGAAQSQAQSLVSGWQQEVARIEAQIDALVESGERVRVVVMDTGTALMEAYDQSGATVKASGDAAAKEIKETGEAAARDVKAAKDVVHAATVDASGGMVKAVQELADKFLEGMQVTTNKVTSLVNGQQQQLEVITASLDRVARQNSELATKVEVVSAQVRHSR